MFNMLASAIPDPLHPAIVHLPIALAVLVPVFAVGALIAIRRKAPPHGAWGVTVALLLALTASSWVAIETGEDQEERVERVVADAPLGTHEDAADQFLWLSAGVLIVAGVGLLSGRVGTSARILATAGSAALLIAGYRVGHSGGELVYTHGAASAYVPSTAPTALSAGDSRDGSATDRDDDSR